MGKLKCVATSYPVITDKFFRCRGKQVEVIKLHGSVELAPHFLLADAIVDLVETGATLKANNLVEWELVTTVQPAWWPIAAAITLKVTKFHGYFLH